MDPERILADTPETSREPRFRGDVEEVESQAGYDPNPRPANVVRVPPARWSIPSHGTSYRSNSRRAQPMQKGTSSRSRVVADSLPHKKHVQSNATLVWSGITYR